MKSFKAFTIVELLVVMAVIGVLLSLAVFGIQALQKNQRETQRLSDLRNIQGSLESYYSKYRRYPNGEQIYIENNNYSLLETDTNGARFVSIPIQSLTPTIMTREYMYVTCDANEGENASADSWWVGYGTSVQNNPQQYELYACTENGKSVNLGTAGNPQ